MNKNIPIYKIKYEKGVKKNDVVGQTLVTIFSLFCLLRIDL